MASCYTADLNGLTKTLAEILAEADRGNLVARGLIHRLDTLIQRQGEAIDLARKALGLDEPQQVLRAEL